jgi:pimeloyl-ACP methyl ester carboxylesterase
MRLFRHCTAAVLALSISAAAAAQTPAAAPEPGDATFIIFLRGIDVGREQVTLARSGSNWILSSRGRSGPPFDFTIDRFEMKYTTDWQPIELNIQAAQRGRRLGLATSFAMTTAINEITQQGITNSKNDQISARTIVIPNNFYAAYEALGVRLHGLTSGAELPAYVAPQAEVRIKVRQVEAGTIAVPGGSVETRRYDLLFQNPGNPLAASLTVDQRLRFVRLDIPAAALTVLREDVAGVAARPQTTRNPTDADVTIPASGFAIASTITSPPVTGRLRRPAVVFVGGTAPVDRDETVAGIPIFTQLAGALAERGFMAVRYDKRGVGQSGGRDERATLQDYADDLLAVVRWLRKRKDVDSRRVAVVGYGEGGAVAILAAGREKNIASLVLIGAPGTSGSELVLEQQRHVLDVLKTPDAERQDKIALQQKIHEAIKTDKGWEGIPEDLRTQAETPWFRSFLLFDPAKAMSRVKQPILIVQGGRDTQVFPHHADRLAEIAQARKNAPPVAVKRFPQLNHLLVPAETGEISEYPTLKERTVSTEVANAISEWLLR